MTWHDVFVAFFGENPGTKEIIAQVIGFVAIIMSFFIPQQRTKLRLLLFKLMTDWIWIAHWILVGAFTGAAVTMIAILRTITFMILDKRGKKKNNWFLALFLCLAVAATVFTWKDAWSLFSLCTSILGTLAYWQTNVNHSKIILFCVSLCQIPYALHNHSVAVICNEILVMSSIILFFVRVHFEKRREKQSGAQN